MKFEAVIRKFDPSGIQETEGGGNNFKKEAKFRALRHAWAQKNHFGCIFEWIPNSKLIRKEMNTRKTYKK